MENANYYYSVFFALTVSAALIASLQSKHYKPKAENCREKTFIVKAWVLSKWCVPSHGCPRLNCSDLNVNIESNKVVIRVPRGVGGGEIYSLEKYKEGTFSAELDFLLSPGVRYAFFLGVFDEGKPQN